MMKTSPLKKNVHDVDINGKYTVISLFAGGGGSLLGYKKAGYKELLAIDWDDNAIQTLKANFNIPTLKENILNLHVDTIFKYTNIKRGELDILDGSPPCQGFSTIGVRKINDPRNDLYKRYIYFLNELQPKVFVMENVPGLIKGKMKGYFIDIMNDLKNTNYNVRCRLLNAKYYNVPQSRSRLIWIGVRKDINILPTYPIPSNKIITVEKALSDCIANENIPELKDKYKELWNKIKPGHSGISILKTKGYTNCRKIHPKKPVFTIIATQGLSGANTITHWKYPRALTINEAKRLCSFPDNYILTGNYMQQWKLLGNAVMPEMMYKIAEHIKINILDKFYNNEKE